MRSAIALAAVLLAAACASPAPRPAPAGGAAIAAAATALLGTAYHFGGADAAGFDCSGLAHYVHERAGLMIPRTAAEQQQAAQPVPLRQLAPGDLLFFSLHSGGVDHVGVYTGADRFVHAPRAGLAVAYGDLHGGSYYARHLVSAGRFWGTAAPAPRR